MLRLLRFKLGFLISVMSAVGMLTAVACGAAEEATATPTNTPVPTGPPTATAVAVAVGGPVATPTPTQTPTPAATAPADAMMVIKKGGTLTIALSNDTTTFDPTRSVTSWDLPAVGNLTSFLLVNRIGSEVECDLCTTWELKNDGKTMVFNLHKNAKFQDGTTLTAEDVKYTWLKLIGEIDGVISPRCGTIKEYVDHSNPNFFEVADPYTFKVHLEAPSGAVPYYMALNYCGMVPEGTTSDDLKTSPNGSGPFRIGKWEQGALMRMIPNPDYYRTETPYLDTLDFVIIADGTARSAAVITGRADQGGISGAGPDQWKLFQQFADEGKGAWLKSICECFGGTLMAVNIPPFDDKNLRHAINLAMDRRSQMEIMFSGAAKPTLYIPPSWPGARSPDEIWDKVDGWGTGANKEAEIERAKKLVSDGGYGNLKLTDWGGTWYVYPQQAEWTTPQLTRIGLDVEIKLLDRGSLLPKLSGIDYQLATYYYGFGFPEPDIMLGSYFLTGGSRNWTGFSTPFIDQLFVKQRSELDPQKRIQLVREAEDFLLDVMPIAPIAMPFGDSLIWAHFKGWDAGLGGMLNNRYEHAYDGRIQ